MTVLKLFFLLVTIIFLITFLRSFMNAQKVRAYLSKKHPLSAHVFAALFEWKITAIYIGFGLLVAIIGGFIIGCMKMEQYVLIPVKPIEGEIEVPKEEQISLKHRSLQASEYTYDLIVKVLPYVFLGVGLGAFIHGYVPQDFIIAYTGKDNPFAVIVAVVLGIPMYSNAAGIISMIDALIAKRMVIGTALAFMITVTALNLPEAIILKRILHIRLIALFFGIVGLGIIAIGYIFNFLI